MDANGFNAHDTLNGTVPPDGSAPTIDIKARRSPGRKASGNQQAQAADATEPGAPPTASDVLTSKPTHADTDTLRWWAPRLPVQGDLGEEWKKHEGQLTGLVKGYPLRTWHSVRLFLLALGGCDGGRDRGRRSERGQRAQAGQRRATNPTHQGAGHALR